MKMMILIQCKSNICKGILVIYSQITIERLIS